MWGEREPTIKENELTQEEQADINAQHEEELKNDNLTVLDVKSRQTKKKRDLARMKERYEKQINNVDNQNMPLKMLEKNEIDTLSKLNGKIRKSLSASIGAYNVAQRRLDNLNPYLSRETKSNYPCGSITCKQRGRNIKNALIDLSQFSEEALGSIGVGTFIKSAANYLVGNNDQTRRKEQVQPENPTPPPPPKEKKGWFWGGKTRKHKRFQRKSRR
jgi:hypothetical protein